MKTILVTGGNRGIGLEICNQLAVQGHTVIMGTRDLERGQNVAKTLSGKVHVMQLDVTDPESIKSLANDIDEEFGHLDVLINNAGIGVGNSGAVDADPEEVKAIMATNFYGPWYTIQGLIPLLKKSTDGRIVNMSSGMGAMSDLTGGYAGYRLSKTSLNGLTILLANELAGEVKVNAMCPGWVRTDMGGSGAPRSVKQGADTAVWLATADPIPTGKFFRDRREISW